MVSVALPPINPTIAPKPIFQVVVQVSNRLTCSCDGEAQNDRRRDVIKDDAVSITTVEKTHLKTEFEFFITHPIENLPIRNGNESGLTGATCIREISNPFRLLLRLGGWSGE
jgi:hypothetical protein